MIFIFPMAGEGRRFRDAGYVRPKFELPVHDASLFDFAVRSFSAYRQSDGFLFVVRDSEVQRFVRERCSALGIDDVRIVVLNEPTDGQADTVLQGLNAADVADIERITIFNIDTFRPGYRKPPLVTEDLVDGYLEVFRGSGPNWSFVAPDAERPGRITEVSEKRPISDLCCTGLYYFRRASDFRWAYHNPSAPRSEAEARERYVAPLYNALIAAGRAIGFELVEAADVIVCGTPDEYAHALGSDEIARRLNS